MRILVIALIFQCSTPLVAQRQDMDFQKLVNLLNNSLALNGVKFCVSNNFNDKNFNKKDVVTLFNTSLKEDVLYSSSRNIGLKSENGVEYCNCMKDSLEKWVKDIEYNDSVFSNFLEKYLLSTNKTAEEIDETDFGVALSKAISDRSIQFIQSTYFIIEIKSLQKISKNKFYIRLSNTRIGKIPNKKFSDVLIGSSKGTLTVLDISTY